MKIIMNIINVLIIISILALNIFLVYLSIINKIKPDIKNERVLDRWLVYEIGWGCPRRVKVSELDDYQCSILAIICSPCWHFKSLLIVTRDLIYTPIKILLKFWIYIIYTKN